MRRNTSGQKWRVFAFDSTTNQEVTGDAANITAKISKDWGAATALGDVNPTETEDGYYLFDLTAAETNAHEIAIYPESSTPDVQVIGVPGSYVTEGAAALPTAPVGSFPCVILGPMLYEDTEPTISVGYEGNIYATVGSTTSVAIECNQSVNNLSLTFIVETKWKTDVATVANGSISKDGSTATLALTAPMTTSERTLRWSLVNDGNGEQVAGGLLFVTYDAQGD